MGQPLLCGFKNAIDSGSVTAALLGAVSKVSGIEEGVLNVAAVKRQSGMHPTSERLELCVCSSVLWT